jgi:FixJ family two-component response regulator
MIARAQASAHIDLGTGPRSTIAPSVPRSQSRQVRDVKFSTMPLISIVDDDLSVRRALRRLVRSAGYSVETFASAREFLDSLPSGRTACLVLDIHLEGMSGFELQEQMAADAAPIPVIFITAQDDAATRERARQTSACAYLRKPFDEQVLLAAIGRAIGVDGHQRDGHQTPPTCKQR